MNTLQAVLAVLGSLFALAIVGSVVWVYVKSGADDLVKKRLREERDDLLSRLNYIEPRFKAAQEQNEVLRTLLDPSARLEELRTTIGERAAEILDAVERSASNTNAMKAVLLSQARTLDDISAHMHIEKG